MVKWYGAQRLLDFSTSTARHSPKFNVAKRHRAVRKLSAGIDAVNFQGDIGPVEVSPLTWAGKGGIFASRDVLAYGRVNSIFFPWGGEVVQRQPFVARVDVHQIRAVDS